MKNPSTIRTETNITLCGIARELFSRGSVYGMLHELGYSSMGEVSICESQLMYKVSCLYDEGVEMFSSEWFCALNAMAGSLADYAEDATKAEYYSGNPAAYAAIWNQFAYWTHYAPMAA